VADDGDCCRIKMIVAWLTRLPIISRYAESEYLSSEMGTTLGAMRGLVSEIYLRSILLSLSLQKRAV
jgi:hypothetical protein